MPAITYSDFSGGLDRRLPVNVAETNRLWILSNAYITNGKKIKKRHGLKPVTLNGMTGLVGLSCVQSTNTLVMFKELGAPYRAPTMIAINQTVPVLDPPSQALGTPLTRIHYADYFAGHLYVVAGYGNGAIAHHYLDGIGPTYISDVNCPNSISVTKAASRIFAINGETVRYCAAGTPRDWTASNDAGFLPVSLQQDNGSEATAVGTFQDALVVFFPEGAQVWDVAIDPSANKIRKRLYGAGTRSPLSLASFGSDLVFLSHAGFRSMTVALVTDRIDDTDVGVPVDSLVVPDLNNTNEQVRGVWLAALGQYWAIFAGPTGSKVWVYTFSRSSRIACWSSYEFPVFITDVTSMNGKVYVRTATQIYEVTHDVYTDDGAPIPIDAQFAFQDAKTPGVSKQWTGFDAVMAGTWDISFLYDPRDLGKETASQQLTGDMRPGDIAAVEAVVPALAPVFRHSGNEPAEIDALSIYYENLGINF